jgi:hypothetical protein
VAASALLQELHDCAPVGHFTLEWLTTSLRKQSYGAMIFLLAILAAAPGISMAAYILPKLSGELWRNRGQYHFCGRPKIER